VEEKVEGRNAVAELLASDRKVNRLFVLEGAKPGDVLTDLVGLARARGVRVDMVARRELDRMSERGAHQGVVALVEPYRYASLDEVIAHGSSLAASLVVVLDHVTDPQNLGAVVRTAEVVGASGVLIPKDRAAGMTPSAMKAAAGAAEHMHVARITTWCSRSSGSKKRATGSWAPPKRRAKAPGRLRWRVASRL
jgi:23S rRNA (guanosine2251-2'-O)-methyltransferase